MNKTTDTREDLPLFFLKKASLSDYISWGDHLSTMSNLRTELLESLFKEHDTFARKCLKLAPKHFPANPWHELTAYAIDATQRHIKFYDVLRKRGNNYLEHIRKGQPPVLAFKYDIVLDGRNFQKPVNYALVKIRPTHGTSIDDTKRPLVIIDPRAGHGPGIGGFKHSSQVGVSLRAGHPVYFMIFFPLPEEGQTLMNVNHAQILFLEKVAKLHKDAPPPCVVGNCQGGWAAACLAIMRPRLMGPIILNGAPLSYWAGEDGKNPMRYTAGLVGGSWLSSYLADLGNGRFDGANLVANFEYLNPANTLFDRYYKLYESIDTEEERFLDFERWWGGFSLMNKEEMIAILDNLFIGDKLSGGQIRLDRSHNLDMRSIQAPLFVFCSEGDNITPPQQALKWIVEVYESDKALREANQVIIYMVHRHIGHLGLFVSGQIVTSEFSYMINIMKDVEALPPGLYEIVYDAKNETFEIENRTLEELSNAWSLHKDNDKKFSLVNMVSDFNALAYDLFIGPKLRLYATENTASTLRQLHPLRWSRYMWSDLNPLLAWSASARQSLDKKRMPIKEPNIFLDLEKLWAKSMSHALTTYRILRDHAIEVAFHLLYGYLSLMGAEAEPKQSFVAAFQERSDEAVVKDALSALRDGDVLDAALRIILLLTEEEGTMDEQDMQQIIEEFHALCKSEKNSPNSQRAQEKLKHQMSLVASTTREDALNSLPDLLRDPRHRQKIIEFLSRAGRNISLYQSKGALWRQLSILLEE